MHHPAGFQLSSLFSFDKRNRPHHAKSRVHLFVRKSIDRRNQCRSPASRRTWIPTFRKIILGLEESGHVLPCKIPTFLTFFYDRRNRSYCAESRVHLFVRKSIDRRNRPPRARSRLALFAKESRDRRNRRRQAATPPTPPVDNRKMQEYNLMVRV